MSKIWKTKDGNLIPIKDMTDNHLVNAIRFLEINVGKYKQHLINEAYEALNFLTGDMKIKHWLGFHNPLNCKKLNFGEDGYWGEDRQYYYPSPWSRFTVIKSRYECLECGRKFWMPQGNFEEWKMQENLYNMTKTAVKILEKRGDYEEAKELLKF